MNDFRYAARTLLQSPGFTLAAVAMLALAVGASTAVFSIANDVLLDPLAYREPDRIVRLLGVNPRGDEVVISYPDFLDVVAQSGAFARAAAFQEWQPAVSGSGDAEVLSGATVDSGFFDVLGVRPARGRFFVPQEDRPGGDIIVVLSHALWQRKFGGREDVVGKTILLDARPMTVIGIAPRDFEEPYLLDNTRRIDVWTTNALDLAQDQAPRGSRSYTAIARLEDGVTLESANARVAAVTARLGRTYPETTGHGMQLVPLKVRMTGGVRKPLWVLFAAVLLLLLLACVNIANLLLARVERKGRDAAIRVALGATNWHLLRQVFAETTLLAVAGSAAGVLVAMALLRRIVAFGAASIPRLTETTLDLRVLFFVVAATFVTALLVGLVPALQLRSGKIAVRANARGATAAAPAVWAQSMLVIVQVAISIVLLVAAALVGRSLWNLMNVDIGIDQESAITFNVRAPRTEYRGRPKLIAFYRELTSRLGRIPGVEAVGATTSLPLGGDFYSFRVRIEGRPELPPAERPSAELRGVTPGYFAAVGLPILSGRGITEGDGESAPKVMVIDETFARKHWPGQSPLGARVTANGESFEIVGIVRAARILSLAAEPEPAMYVPHAQAQTFRSMSVIVRSREPLATLAPAIRATVAALSADAPLSEIRPFRDVVSGAAASQRFRTMLLLAFGGAALLLATLGIAGTLAYLTSRREREIGVRMALGATARQIVSLVLSRGVLLVGAGIAAGALAALAATRLLQSLLFGVAPADPLSYAAVAATLLLAGIAASAIPAARAARTDPMTVMRAE